MNENSFSYLRRVNFYDTDLMGIVHHSNYIRYFEEARSEWVRCQGLAEYHGLQGQCILIVLESAAYYRRPACYEDMLSIRVQARLEGAKIRFEYQVWRDSDSELLTTGYTLHAAVKPGTVVPIRMPKVFVDVIKEQKWCENWV